MKKLALSLALAALSTGAIADNVALGKTVTLFGIYGTDGWGGPAPAAASTVTDGTFLAEGNQWDTGTVWWNGSTNPRNFMTIDLGGAFKITGLVVQADDNDSYPVYYRNGAAGPYYLLWDVPAVGGGGMRTRSMAVDIMATAFAIGNPYLAGDGFYSVSEFQAIGTPVPEPETYAMMLAGLGVLGAMARRRRS